MSNTELNTLLKQKKIATDPVIKQLQREWQGLKSPTSWEDFLLDKKTLSEDQLMEIKAAELNVPAVDLRNEQIPPDVLALVPEPIAHRHKVISFAKTKTELSLAMVDPTDIQTKEFMKKKTGLEIKVFLIGKTSLDFGLAKYHSNLEGEIKHLVREGKPDVAGTAGAEGL